MIRAIGALCLAAALLLSVSGCGEKEPDQPKPPTAKQPEQPEAPEAPATDKPKDHPAH